MSRLLGALCVLVPVLTLSCCLRTGAATNAPGSNPTLWVVQSIPAAPAEQALLASVQGLLNTTNATVWIRAGGLHEHTLEQVRPRYRIEPVPDVWALIAAHRSRLSRFVLCSVTNDTLNHAFSLAGTVEAVVADVTLGPRLSSLGLGLVTDLTAPGTGQDTLAGLRDHARGLLVHQPVTKPLHLRDLAVARRAFVEYPDTAAALTDRVRELGPDTEVLGWGRDEHEFVQAVSRGGGWVLPADWALNLSAHRWLEATPPSPANKPSWKPARRGERIVCFVISDGDNIQWLLGGFTDRPGFWSSPRRGSFCVTWELAPRLAELAPAAHAWLIGSATPLDSFVGGPSGGGYFFPHAAPDRERANRRSANALARAGFRITSVLDSGGSPEELESLLADGAVDAVFYKDYAPYNRRRGAVSWVRGKPVIAYRHLLWEQARPDGRLRTDWLPEGVAQAIAGGPDDPVRTTEAFSLVQVHAWSFRDRGGPLEAVHDTIRRLPTGTRVVGAEEFVGLITALKP